MLDELTPIGTIAGMWRYPVKSMRGEALASGKLSANGLAGDRAYALVDQATGKVGSAKHPRLWGRLLDCHAAIVDSHNGRSASSLPAVRITLPDGQIVLAGTDEADIALAALLGRAVKLAAQAPDQPEIERYWPDIEGMAQRDTVTVGPIGLGAPAGGFFDFAPLHLLATSSLDQLQALHPAGSVAAARFRPNLLIRPGNSATDLTAGFVENGWEGRTLLIGDQVRLRVISPTPRCVVPTLPQPDVPQDLGILRTLVAHNSIPIARLEGSRRASLGVYAVVEQGGAICSGDSVWLAHGGEPS